MPVEMLTLQDKKITGVPDALLPLTVGGYRQAKRASEMARWAYQIVGTLNEVPAVDPECLIDFDKVKTGLATGPGNPKDDVVKKGCVIHHIPLGIVSHAVSKAPSEAARLFALKSSEDMTSLPQIEILM